MSLLGGKDEALGALRRCKVMCDIGITIVRCCYPGCEVLSSRLQGVKKQQHTWVCVAVSVWPGTKPSDHPLEAASVEIKAARGISRGLIARHISTLR